jgi:hypothetical protein
MHLYQIHSSSFEQLVSSDEQIFHATQYYKNSTFCPQSAFVCFVWISHKKTVNIPQYSVTVGFYNWDKACSLRGTIQTSNYNSDLSRLIRSVRENAKSDYCVSHGVCLSVYASVCLSASNNSTATGRILIKCDIDDEIIQVPLQHNADIQQHETSKYQSGTLSGKGIYSVKYVSLPATEWGVSWVFSVHLQ